MQTGKDKKHIACAIMVIDTRALQHFLQKRIFLQDELLQEASFEVSDHSQDASSFFPHKGTLQLGQKELAMKVIQYNPIQPWYCGCCKW